MAYVPYPRARPTPRAQQSLICTIGSRSLIVELDLQISIMHICGKEREMAQWLERGALPMSLPAVRFRIQLGAEFSEKYNVSPLSILGHC